LNCSTTKLLADPFDLYRELRNQAPVVRMSRYVFSRLRSASILAVSSILFLGQLGKKFFGNGLLQRRHGSAARLYSFALPTTQSDI
jgi:hypothetical protein